MSTLFASRKFWIAAVTFIVCLVLVLALGADRAGQAITSATVLAGTLIGAIAYEDGKEKGADKIINSAEKVSSNLLMWFLLATVLLMSGCAQTPTARWVQARDTLSTTQNLIREAHSQKLISDADLLTLDPFAQSARGSLKQAEQRLPDGGSDFEFYLNLTNDTLRNLGGDKLNQLEAGHVRGGNPGGDSGGGNSGASGSADPGLRDPADRTGQGNWVDHRGGIFTDQASGPNL